MDWPSPGANRLTCGNQDGLKGAQLLRQGCPVLSPERDTVIVPAPPAVLIRQGVAYQSVRLPDDTR